MCIEQREDSRGAGHVQRKQTKTAFAWRNERKEAPNKLSHKFEPRISRVQVSHSTV